MAAACVSRLRCASGADYVAPPESSDPWEFIEHARGALQRGRPRAALPSLRRADVEAEKVDRSTPAYTHVKAAICNELGRVYLMAGDLDTAEAEFLRCIPLAESLQQRRPLHFDIAYNASTLYEAKATRVESLASWKAHKRDPLAKWRTSASLRASGSVVPGTHSSDAAVLATESCTHLRRAAELHRHLVAVPAEPPDGWGGRWRAHRSDGRPNDRSARAAARLRARPTE